MSFLKSGFLAGPNGDLHVSIFTPENGAQPPSWAIYVPPFAEEMNKCRGMMSRQARALADQGYTVVSIDLSGTGDSEGDFETTDWDSWKADLLFLSDWILRQGAVDIVLWAVRAGCLLAADLVQNPEYPIRRAVFWQPVHSGRQHIAQFLRVRMAASLMKGGSETVAALRERAVNEKMVEVAGYSLSSGLIEQLEAVSLSDFDLPLNTSIELFELVATEGKELSPLSRRQLTDWESQGLSCRGVTLVGEPFWMTQELAFSQSLIDETTMALSLDVDEAALPESTLISEIKPSSDSDSSKAVQFECDDAVLSGILHRSQQKSTTGLIVVVGGPQYRVGSHRQFTLLGRFLSQSGIPVLRFDYRGMGDSSGELLGFENVTRDIRAAVDMFERSCPELDGIVLWGLCDGATASLFYAPSDARVKGLVLVNPWVHSAQGAAMTYLRHYYFSRLFSRGFWRKVVQGEYDFLKSFSSLGSIIMRALGRPVARAEESSASGVDAAASTGGAIVGSADLVARFASSLEDFKGETFVILSGDDFTAAEFIDASGSNGKLRKAMTKGGLDRKLFPDADHTFSASDSWVAVQEATLDWCHRLSFSTRQQ